MNIVELIRSADFESQAFTFSLMLFLSFGHLCLFLLNSRLLKVRKLAAISELVTSLRFTSLCGAAFFLSAAAVVVISDLDSPSLIAVAVCQTVLHHALIVAYFTATRSSGATSCANSEKRPRLGASFFGIGVLVFGAATLFVLRSRLWPGKLDLLSTPMASFYLLGFFLCCIVWGQAIGQIRDILKQRVASEGRKSLSVAYVIGFGLCAFSGYFFIVDGIFQIGYLALTPLLGASELIRASKKMIGKNIVLLSDAAAHKRQKPTDSGYRGTLETFSYKPAAEAFRDEADVDDLPSASLISVVRATVHEMSSPMLLLRAFFEEDREETLMATDSERGYIAKDAMSRLEGLYASLRSGLMVSRLVTPRCLRPDILKKTIELTKKSVTYLATEQDIDLSFKTPASIKRGIDINADKFLFLIFNSFINARSSLLAKGEVDTDRPENLAKPFIKIDIDATETELVTRISDNGYGMSESDTKVLLGQKTANQKQADLARVIQILRATKGSSLNVSTDKHIGTSLEFCFPLVDSN